jgi:hypothetical protein
VIERAEAGHHLRYLARQRLLPIVAILVALALAFVVRRSPARSASALAVFPALVVVESVAAVWPFWPRIPASEFYPVTPVHAFLRDHQGHDRVMLQNRTLEPGTPTFTASGGPSPVTSSSSPRGRTCCGGSSQRPSP